MRLGALALVASIALVSPAATQATSGDASCDALTARATLRAFVHAFNHGQQDRLQRLFAQTPEFGWYSVAPPHGRTNQRAQDRSSLIAYFRARHSRMETIRVTSFSFASTEERNGARFAHFSGRITRTATDLPLERRGFKAAIRCDLSTQFVVVSIGTRL